MIIVATDGRRVRVNRGAVLVPVETSEDGRYVWTDIVRADGARMGGPCVTASEWHRYRGNVWTRCPGSGGRPASVRPNRDGWYYGAGTCPVCGNGVDLTHSGGRVFSHRRPVGAVFTDGAMALIGGAR